MYLTCPKCETVYTVRAAMLREGQGEVRCGACQTLFNALDYLSDDLPQAEAEHPGQDQAAEQPGVVLADGADTVVARVEPDLAAGLPSIRPSPEDRLPEVLAGDWDAMQRGERTLSRSLALGALAVALLLALGAQYLWFSPRDLVARFPQSASFVERFCNVTGCLVPQQRDPSKIQVLSREVRAHPRYEGALLVSATFSNVAPWPQPLPLLRFRLYNVNGQTIASRVFSPQQYLAGALPADARLPPGQPLQIMLEMLAPEEAPLSFEFSFL